MDSVEELTQGNNIVFISLSSIIRRLRIRAGEITLVLTNIDFLKNKDFNEILSPIIRIRLLKQNSSNIDYLEKKIQLSEKMGLFLINLNRGEGLIKQDDTIPFSFKKRIIN